MADSSLLASIISGNDPLAPQMVPAYMAAQQSQQMLDPNYGMNQGPFGALARVLAGATGNGQGALKDAVANVTAQRQAANPEILGAVTNPSGPLNYAAQHPGMNPVALAHILAQPPDTVQNYIEAARLGRSNQPGATPLVPSALPGWGKVPGVMSPAQVAPLAAVNKPAPQAAFPQDYTGRPASEPDVGTIAAMPPVMQAQALARMNPAQKAALAAMIAKYRAQGGGNAAVRPPT